MACPMHGRALQTGFPMTDVHQLLARQALWQKHRKDLPWPEKIRMVEAIREAIVRLRATAPRKRVEGHNGQRDPRNP